MTDSHWVLDYYTNEVICRANYSHLYASEWSGDFGTFLINDKNVVINPDAKQPGTRKVYVA